MFRVLSRTGLASAALLLSSQVAAYDFHAIASNHILPAYRALASASDRLEHQAQAYCGGDAGALPALQDAHRQAFLAWQGAQHIRFGPVQYLSRENRLELWPDKRGVVARHLRKLLAGDQLQQVEFDIAGKSVAVQGFSALEHLLFSEQAPDEKRCLLIGAIAANVRQIANGIVHDWTEGEAAYDAYFETPGPQNPLFTSSDELAGTLLNSLHTELELLESQKLGRPLGKSAQDARGRRAEAWRSGSSLAAMQRNLRATQGLFDTAFAPQLAEDDPLRERIHSAFDAIQAQLAQVPTPLSDSVQQPRSWQRLQQIQQSIIALRRLVGQDLARTLKLSIGFNSLDGD